MGDFFKFLQPVHDAWWAIFGVTLQAMLTWIYNHLAGVAIFEAIGAYGVAIIVITIIIRVLLSPLQQFQLVTQRKTYAEQRKLAPEVAELRKKFRKDPQKLNSEMMKLYQEHGVNPLSSMIGCLPLVLQIPILTALYYVFTGWAHTHGVAPFLFVPNLNENPNHHVIGSSIPIPVPVYLIFPLLAGITTLIQTRMLQMPPPPNPTEQEAQTLQMQRTMLWISPMMIFIFALNVPAGLALYWFVGNCVSIIQQSFVVGWGNLVPSRFKTVAGGAPSAPTKGPSTGPKTSGPQGGGGPGGGGGAGKPNRPKKKK
ncbi:MAG TPA: YidC/Oxa1 family membrane protein insertase [Candidatus Dormibacteraeota bacterium]|nr:YidC/Oxa1 family membrane protein insertase [Candidatus Dormibacteraeota bacterium]